MAKIATEDCKKAIVEYCAAHMNEIFAQFVIGSEQEKEGDHNQVVSFFLDRYGGEIVDIRRKELKSGNLMFIGFKIKKERRLY